MDVLGRVAEGWGSLADALADVASGDAGDASWVSVYHDGVLVADICAGGFQGRAVEPSALVRVASCSKGVTATALARLIERGLVDADELVTDRWPEYGQNGKQGTTLAMVASHRAGVPYPAPGSGLEGIEYFTSPKLLEVLAAQRPLWEPGTVVAYHPATAGAILDEFTRRATGRDISRVLSEEIVQPLGLRMWLGLPMSELGLVRPGSWAVEAEPSSEPATEFAMWRQRALEDAPPFEPDFDDPDAVRGYYSASMPGVGVVTDAHSLARMYAATVGPVDGIRLMSDSTRTALTRDLTVGLPRPAESGTAGPDLAFGFGYQLPTSSMSGLTAMSFGHTGAGGRLGLADPDLGVGFAFTTLRMKNIGPGGDPRWRVLMDVVRSLTG